MIRKTVPLRALVMLLVTSSIMAQTPEGLLPQDNEISGWTHDLDTLCKEGVATDTTSLYGIIDGGADKYSDRGFVSGVFKGFTNGSDVICIEIYDQGTVDSALSVSQFFRSSGGYLAITELGNNAYLDTTYLSEYYLELVAGTYFIRLSGPREDSYKQALITFAHTIANDVPIKKNPAQSKSLLNKITIAAYPTNGGYIFKICANSSLINSAAPLEMSIYNSRGTLVKRVHAQRFSAQNYIAEWDGKNLQGTFVGNGLYTVLLESGNVAFSKKIMIGR